MTQLDHYSSKFSKRTFPITVVCQNVTNAPNVGSLFRTADAFGIEELIFCGNQIPLGRKMMKTSRATENVVNYDTEADALDVVTQLKSDGHFIVSLEVTTDSSSLHSYSFPTNKSIVLVIGDENFGISESILNISDAVLHIDMFGQNSSMNVVQATSVTLFEITRQIR